MKMILKIACVLSCFMQTAFSQTTVTFNKTYHNGVDNAFNVLELPDGYLTCITSGFPTGERKMEISKVDFNGDLVWQKSYGDSTTFDSFYSLIQLTDSTFITGTYSTNRTTGINYIKFIKFNSNGDSLWTNTIPSIPGFEYYPQFTIKTSDNGFLISGEIADSLITDGDAFILKTDSLGNEQWHKIYGGNNFDNFYSSIQLQDNSFLSLGWTRSFGAGDRDVYLVKTDSGGNFVWQKIYGGNDNDIGIGITSTADTNFILCGGSWLNNGLTYYGSIYKIDSAGVVLTQKNYLTIPTSEFWWVRENIDETYIGTGSNRLLNKDNGWIAKLDTNLDLLWTRSFAINNNTSYLRDVKATTDGGYIAAGFVFTGVSGGQDAWLVKLDSLGCDSIGCATYTTGINDIPIITHTGLNVFPNPANDFITLLWQQPLFTACKINIYDIMGKQVLNQLTFIQNKVSLPVSSLAKGIYVVQVVHEGKKEFSKFLKE